MTPPQRPRPRRGLVWWTGMFFAASVIGYGSGLAALALPGSSSGEAAEVCAGHVDQRAQLPAAAEPRPSATVEVVSSYRYRVTGVVDYFTGAGELIRSAGYVCRVHYVPASDRWVLIALDIDE